MKASVLRTDKRCDSRNDRSLGIQTYGENNDYPQRLLEISEASGTAKSCLRTYAKFIGGQGFTNQTFYAAVVNRQGHSADHLLNLVAHDYAHFWGFALHINYNAMYQITEVQHIPFEHVRFEKLDDDGLFNRVAIHPDWGRRYQSLRRFKKDEISFVDLFDPSPEEIDRQVEAAGGWDNYRGQVFYFSLSGERTYPTPIYDPVLTDMNTEEGIANVKNRNARNNFLTAGMLIDRRRKGQSHEQDDEVAEELRDFQTDTNACKLIYVEVESEEEEPKYVPFRGENYDSEFEYSEQSVQQNIGRVFNQPPILRAENIGANFGADLMTNAYNYYNAVTRNERLDIERTFERLFSLWHTDGINPTCDYTVTPLQYLQ